MESETRDVAKGLSLRTVLLLVLVIGVAAGATAYAIGTVFGASALSSNAAQQSTATSTSISHNCTLTSLGYIRG